MSSWQNVSQNTCWQNVFLTKRLSKIHDKMSPWQYVFLTKRLQTVLVTFPNFDNHRFLFASRDTADTQQLLRSALQKFEIKLCRGCDRSDWSTIPHTENIDWSQVSWISDNSRDSVRWKHPKQLCRNLQWYEIEYIENSQDPLELAWQNFTIGKVFKGQGHIWPWDKNSTSILTVTKQNMLSSFLIPWLNW